MNEWLAALAAVVGAISGAGGTLLALRRRLSSDNTAIAVEDAQQGFLATLQHERDEARDEARDAARDLAKAKAEIAGLKASLGAVEREKMRQTLEFAAFKRMVLRIHPDLAEYVISDYGDTLGDAGVKG